MTMSTFTVVFRPVPFAVAHVCGGLVTPAPIISVAAAFGAGALAITERHMRRTMPGRTLT